MAMFTRDELNFIRHTLAVHNAEIHNLGAARMMGVSSEELQRRYDDAIARLDDALERLSMTNTDATEPHTSGGGR